MDLIITLDGARTPFSVRNVDPVEFPGESVYEVVTGNDIFFVEYAAPSELTAENACRIALLGLQWDRMDDFEEVKK